MGTTANKSKTWQMKKIKQIFLRFITKKKQRRQRKTMLFRTNRGSRIEDHKYTQSKATHTQHIIWHYPKRTHVHKETHTLIDRLCKNQLQLSPGVNKKQANVWHRYLLFPVFMYFVRFELPKKNKTKLHVIYTRTHKYERVCMWVCVCSYPSASLRSFQRILHQCKPFTYRISETILFYRIYRINSVLHHQCVHCWSRTLHLNHSQLKKFEAILRFLRAYCCLYSIFSSSCTLRPEKPPSRQTYFYLIKGKGNQQHKNKL